MLSQEEIKYADYTYTNTNWKKEWLKTNNSVIEERFRKGLDKYIKLVSDEVKQYDGVYSAESQIICFDKYVRFRIGIMHQQKFISDSAIGYDHIDSTDYERLAFYTLHQFGDWHANKIITNTIAVVNKKIHILILKGKWDNEF